MSDNETSFLHATAGDENFERILNLQAAMLTAAAMDQLSDDLDPALHTGLTISAGCLLAGYLFGATIVAGMASDKDKRRACDMALSNFRMGIKLGKDQALLSLADQPGTGRA
jgi:hypothetical protein